MRWPSTSGDKTKDKNEEDTTGKEEAAKQRNSSVFLGRIPRALIWTHCFFMAGFADDAQITREEIRIEDEAVSKALNDNHGEKTCDNVFRITLRDDGAGASGHGLWSIVSYKQI